MGNLSVFTRESDEVGGDSQPEDNSGGPSGSSESEEDARKEEDSEVEEQFVAETASSKISNRSSPSVLSKCRAVR